MSEHLVAPDLGDAGDVAYDWDLLTDLVVWGESVQYRFGYKIEGGGLPIGWWEERLHPEDQATVVASLSQAVSTAAARWTADYRFRRADGSYAHVVDRGVFLRDPSGRAVRMVGAMVDVSEARRVAEALAASEHRAQQQFHELELVYRTAPVGLFTMDRDGRITRINERLAAMNGLPVAAHLGRRIEELLPGLGSELGAYYRRVLESGESVRDVELAGETPAAHGVRRHWLASYDPIRTPDGEVCGLVGAITEITDRKRAEEELQASEHRFRDLFDRNPMPMWVYDWETLRFLAVNDAAIDHYGWSRAEFLAMSVLDIRPEEDVPALLATLRDEEFAREYRGMHRHRNRAGEILEVEILGRGIAMGGRRARLILARDITDQRRLEQHLRQSQKVEAVGRLAGGVAHDFNNLLSVILTHLDFLREADPSDPQWRADVEQIHAAARRAAGLTRQLLTFARKQVSTPRTLDLNALAIRMDGMLRRLIGEHIDLVTLAAADHPMISADAGQVEQVLVNLAVNARDAMPDGGTLTIETGNVVVEASQAAHNPGVPPGEYVLLAVSDSGAGMTEEVMEHALDPFYTTKPPGKGTGLGLPICLGIVEQHHGHLTLQSEVGKGTTVRCFFPLSAEPESQPEAARPARVRGGRETILLAEDEQAVRSGAARSLRRHGYRVVEADDGLEAIEVAAQEAGDIDLLVTDMVMPRMGGKALAEQLTAARPALRVLFTSGYTEDADVLQERPDAPWAFLPKPYLGDALLREVRRLLDRKMPAARG